MKTSKLAFIASVGGIITASAGLSIRHYTQCKITDAVSYKETMETVRKNPHALYLLGEPIEEGRVNLKDTAANGTDGVHNWITVPVKGPKTKGEVRFWVPVIDQTNNDRFSLVSKKLDGTDEERALKIELVVRNIPGKKLVIRNDIDKQELKQ